MSRHFEISWSDLNSEAQENMIAETVESMLEACKEEGEQLLKRDWHDPKPKTWQEAYVRSYAINSIMWEDYENQDAYLKNPYNKIEDIEIPRESDWADWLNDELEAKAEKACYQAIKHTEVEVEI